MEPLIETEKLTKIFSNKYVDTVALKDVSLTIDRGEFVAITGPSGCGKSTLLSILGLLDNPTSGQYRLCGEPVTTLSRYQKSVLRNRNIGWIFQNFNLIADMTALENVMLPFRYGKHHNANMREKAERMLALVGLEDKANEYPNKLSGGQQQRIAVARALVLEPDLIVADEPTGNLDSENAERVFQLLKKLHASGRTLVMVTHAYELARRCERIIEMRDGRIIGES